jgi:hypothetical protein
LKILRRARDATLGGAELRQGQTALNVASGDPLIAAGAVYRRSLSAYPGPR